MVSHVHKVVPVATALGVVIQLALPVFAQSYNSNQPPANPSYGNSNATSSAPQCSPPQQGRVSYVPAGLVLPVALSTAISTDVARPGDVIEARLNQSVMLGDSVIPAGSTVEGHVTEAKAGGFLGRAGMLTVQFNSLRTPNGAEAPLSAHVIGGMGKYTQIANGSDTVAGETWKNKVGQTALRGVFGAGTGAALGTAIGAIAGHGHGQTGRAVGRGAWSGAAIGGGLGAADGLLLRKGKNVNIAAGTPLQLQLDAPTSISQNVQTGAF